MALGEADGRSRDRERRVPTVLGAVTGLFAALLVSWSVLTPIGIGPDAPGHVSLLRHVADGRGYPEYDEFRPDTGDVSVVFAYRPGVSSLSGSRWLTSSAAPRRSDRPTYEQLGGREPWPYHNQLAQHPPLYYVALAPVGALIDQTIGDQPIERTFLAWGWTNAALVVALPLLAFTAARRLGVGPDAALTAALFPLAVPQLFHIGASPNNDNLLVLLGAVLAVLLAGVVRGDDRTRTALAVGVVAGLALWTKAPAFAFLPWIGVVYAVAALRPGTATASGGEVRPARVVRAGTIALGTTLGVGSFWWARNLVRHGELMPTILDWRSAGPADLWPPPFAYIRRFVPTFTHRFWGNMGSYEAPLSPVLVVTATVVVIVTVLVALAPGRVGRLGRSRVARLRLLGFASVVPLLAVAVFLSAYGYYLHNEVAAQIQGRYLFAALVPLAVVVGVGSTRLAGRWAAPSMLAGASVLQLDATRAALVAFWAEPDASLVKSARGMVAWSPLPEPVTVGLALATLAAAVVTAVLVVRFARAGEVLRV